MVEGLFKGTSSVILGPRFLKKITLYQGKNSRLFVPKEVKMAHKEQDLSQ